MDLQAETLGFTLIRNYKVLKLYGSQIRNPRQFYTYKKLQGSQTVAILEIEDEQFYTYKKLQGSQTPNKV